MNSPVTAAPARSDSPKTVARWIGILTLLTVFGGIYAQGYVAEQLIAWRDAPATAANVVAHKTLYLSAVAVYFVEMGISIATTALFYVLLKPAGRSISMIALCLGIIANALKVGGRVLFAAPVYLVGSTRFHALPPEQLNDISLMLLLVGDHAAGIAMAFFGFQSFLRAWLILRSTFLPKFLGVMSLLGGIAWSTHAWPPLGYKLGDLSLLVGVVGVLVQTVWFLVRGVDEQRWHEQAKLDRL